MEFFFPYNLRKVAHFCLRQLFFSLIYHLVYFNIFKYYGYLFTQEDIFTIYSLNSTTVYMPDTLPCFIEFIILSPKLAIALVTFQ